MGLKCSILGHAFEPTGTETERQEQGSEVVTTVREIEECTRCGKERVVSETTEVTAVVDSEEVDIDEGATTTADIDGGTGADSPDGAGEGGAFDGVVDRSMGEEDAEVLDDTEEEEADEAAADAAAAVDELAETPDEEEEPAIEDRDPEEEDAEILTDDDEPERDPGEWPDDEDVVEAHEPAIEPEDDEEAATDADAGPEPEFEPESADDEDRLAGITVPEGTIVCPECGFTVDAESSYRDGDPCPECGAWLVEDDE